MIQSVKWFLLSSVLVLSLTGPASAHFGNGFPGVGPTPPPPKDRQCAHGCRDAFTQCVGTGRQAFGMCASMTCTTQHDAVVAACGDGTSGTFEMQATDACIQARAAQRECLQPCFSEFRAAVDACRTDGKTCLDTCPIATPSPTPAPQDPSCLMGCRQTLGTCLGGVRSTQATCAEQCSATLQAAIAACTTDFRSAACATARQAAYDCFNPCGTALRDGSKACLDAGHACASACPSPSPQ